MSTINTDLSPFIDLEDIQILFRTLNDEEISKAESLIYVVSDRLREEAIQRGYDLDTMLENGDVLENVVKEVCVAVISRALLASTSTEPMSQYTESALGYSISGTFANPGGGIYIKNSELYALGLLKQKIGGLPLC